MPETVRSRVRRAVMGGSAWRHRPKSGPTPHPCSRHAWHETKCGPYSRHHTSRLLDDSQAVTDTPHMSTRLDAERHDAQVRVEIELGSSDPLDQLRGLRATDRQHDLRQRQTITRAREQGSSWAQIGDALGVTKQAAWALYNEGVRDALEAMRQRTGLTDQQAQQLTDEERDTVRPQ